MLLLSWRFITLIVFVMDDIFAKSQILYKITKSSKEIFILKVSLPRCYQHKDVILGTCASVTDYVINSNSFIIGTHGILDYEKCFKRFLQFLFSMNLVLAKIYLKIGKEKKNFKTKFSLKKNLDLSEER